MKRNLEIRSCGRRGTRTNEVVSGGENDGVRRKSVGTGARALSAGVLAILFALAWAAAPRADAVRRDSPNDILAARALFEANLDAIRNKDRASYLECYLQSDSLARTGPAGFRLGYRELASEIADNTWPDVFETTDLRLVPVREGLVYGTYRYRVRFGAREESGLSERFFLRTPYGWRIAVTSAFPAPPGTPPAPRALVGATLIDGTGGKPIRNAVVLLREGRIECAGPRSQCPVPAGVDTLDLRGLWITPGLVDAHVHYAQSGWADGRPDALDLRARFPYEQVQRELREHPETVNRCYLCSGVTAVFDVGGYPWSIDLAARSHDDTAAPQMVAAGPLLSTIDFWLNLPAESQFLYLASDSAARAGVRYLASRGSAAVKVWFIPDPARDFDEMERVVTAVGEEARSLHLPLIVHATGLREAKAALRAGARLLVHSVWDVPVDAEFLQLAKDHGTIYCPTLTVVDGYVDLYAAARSGRRALKPRLDDPNGCVDPAALERIDRTGPLAAELADTSKINAFTGAPKLHRVMADNLRRVHRAGIPIAMGTDAGNPLTLPGPSVYAEMEAMRAAGMSSMDVLVAATRGGALAMGRLERFGTVEPGKDADLIVVAGDPSANIANLRRLRYVVRGGAVRRLDELRAPGARAAAKR